MEGISQLTSWGPSSQKIVAGGAIVELIVLISGVALTILKSFSIVPPILFCTGGGLLGASMIYRLILCVKSSPPPQILPLKSLTDEEVTSVIYCVLTENDQEKQEAIVQLGKLRDKTNEENARESLYKFVDKPAIIKHLIQTLPRLRELLVSLDSEMVYDSLTDFAKTLTKKDEILQVFLLLDDAHRCALLQTNIKNKNLFLVLIEKAPSTTKEELRKRDWPELFQLAKDLLKAWTFKESFYHVYAALSDEHQKSCLKRILQESQFRSKRFEMIRETKAAIQYPIEFIEYTLGEGEKTSYCGKIRPSFPNDTTKFFDKILPTLPKLHIVTFFWRIARTDFKIWGTSGGWTPEFQGTQEEKEFFKSLSFEQVSRLNRTNQPWVAMWSPSEQSDETIEDICFKRLQQAQKPVIQYQDTQYDLVGKLFKKNWEDFLHLLSFHQVGMLICRDPNLNELNQIFGFKEKFESVPEDLLKGIPNSKHTSFSKRISIPAIL